MTPSLLLRSVLALLVSVAIAGLALTHAAVPPASALNVALTNRAASGPVLASPLPGLSVLASRLKPKQGHGSAHAPRPPARVVMAPGFAIPDFPNVPGHILFDGTDHNIYFVTGRHARRQFTGDGSSGAPALSPQGRSLAWVELQRNYSDIYVTTLAYRRDGAIVAMTTTQLTQDQSPPPDLETSPAPPGWDPRYLWWAQKPSWLPDGRYLLYLSDRPGFDPNDPENATMSVWEQGLTDPITNAVRLTVPASGTGGHDSPQWRPHDPTTFLYVNYYQNTVTLPGGDGVIEAASVPTGTTPSADAITANATDLTPQDATEYQPAWSPDGRYIAFVEDKGHNRSNLLVMPFHAPGRLRDYAHAVTVAKGTPWIVQPFWSPDGRYLGYLSSSGGDFALVIRRAYLGGPRPRFGPPITIPQAGAVSADYRPTWGP